MYFMRRYMGRNCRSRWCRARLQSPHIVAHRHCFSNAPSIMWLIMERNIPDTNFVKSSAYATANFVQHHQLKHWTDCPALRGASVHKSVQVATSQIRLNYPDSSHKYFPMREIRLQTNTDGVGTWLFWWCWYWSCWMLHLYPGRQLEHPAGTAVIGQSCQLPCEKRFLWIFLQHEREVSLKLRFGNRKMCNLIPAMIHDLGLSRSAHLVKL